MPEPLFVPPVPVLPLETPPVPAPPAELPVPPVAAAPLGAPLLAAKARLLDTANAVASINVLIFTIFSLRLIDAHVTILTSTAKRYLFPSNRIGTIINSGNTILRCCHPGPGIVSP